MHTVNLREFSGPPQRGPFKMYLPARAPRIRYYIEKSLSSPLLLARWNGNQFIVIVTSGPRTAESVVAGRLDLSLGQRQDNSK